MKAYIASILSILALGSRLFASDKPNILWITSEDNSIQWVGCYGAENCKTPNLDQLAREGFRYTHCFDNAAVCAPTRSTWITGLYAISMGTQPMRSRYAIPHDRIPYYPDQLRKAGYHIGNGGKTDYNIGSRPDNDCWQGGGSWEKRQPGQPFFVIKNFGDSHESRAFPKQQPPRNDPAKMILHPYHPDLPDMRLTYATYADAVENMDQKVGVLLQKLKDDGLYEDTIVVYCSDHGGVLPRSKRFVYSSGTHCPLIIRIPEKWKDLWPAEKPGMTVERIVSFVDMPKTWLSLCGAEIPETYQGTIFLGPDTEPAPAYHLSFRERADECADTVRAMRDERYLYIKNYMPWAPNGQHLRYMWNMAGTRAWEKHFREGKCDEVTGRFFRPRVSEEFYDAEKDFHNIHNLIDQPKHEAKIAELRKAMRAKQLQLFDSGLLPEAMRLRRAEAHKLTLYDMVRDPRLYPLEKYLDLSDRVLARDPGNLADFVAMLSDSDEGVRYWAVCGLFLLEKQAASEIETLVRALEDDADEVKIMAAWALHKLERIEQAKACLDRLGSGGVSDKNLYQSVRKWMDPEGYKAPEKKPKRNSRGGPWASPSKANILTWMILGPFKDKSVEGPDVFAPALAPDAKWKPLKKGVDIGMIDLHPEMGNLDDCSAFVRVTVTSPRVQTVSLEMKCDDIVVGMLNGRLVKGRTADLKKGDNTLLLKLVDHKKGWKFWCRLVQDGKPVKGVKFLAE